MLFDFKNSCFDNLKEYWIGLTSSKPSSVVETEEYVQINTGMSSEIFNPIFLKENASSLPTLQSSSKYSFWYDSERNKELKIINSQLDPLLLDVPMMYIRLDKEFKQASPDPCSIEILNSNACLNDWIKPIKTAFALSDEDALTYQRCYENTQAKFMHFVAKKDSQTIASASLFLHPKIAGLYNLAVLPEFRRQGIGTALHYIRLQTARAHGYQYATLQATPMARHLDKTIGFEVCSDITIYKIKA